LFKGLVGLEHVSPAKGGPYGKNGKKYGQYLTKALHVSFFQPVPQVVHRSPEHPAIGHDIAVLDPKGTLHTLGVHAQQTTEYHPKGGAGAPQGNGHGHPGNVAQADSTGYGSGKGLEVGHLSRSGRVVVFSLGKIQGMSKPTNIDKAHSDREKGGPKDQPDHDE